MVILVPSSMLNVPPARIPSVESGVLVVSGTVPVPVAGVGPVGTELVEEAVVLVDGVDDEVEVPDGLSAACTAAVRSVLTRCNAVPLAMLARPLA